MFKNRKRWCVGLAWVFVLGIVGCSNDGDLPTPAQVPSAAGLSSCEQPISDSGPTEQWQSGCVWSMSFDALVLARIEDANINHSPSIVTRSDYPNDLLDECGDGDVVPVVSLNVTVLETLHGDVEEGASLSVHFGGAYEWEREPVGVYLDGELVDGEENIDWKGVDLEEVEFHVREEYFGSGTHIGLGLYHHLEPAEAWSPTGEPTFSIGPDGLEYPERSFQCGDAPWEGKSLEELRAGIEACTSTNEAMQRRAHRKETAVNDPRRYIAANCVVMGDDAPEEKLDDGQCIIDSHCEAHSERCVEGECKEADCHVDGHCVDPDEICVANHCVSR